MSIRRMSVGGVLAAAMMCAAAGMAERASSSIINPPTPPTATNTAETAGEVAASVHFVTSEQFLALGRDRIIPVRIDGASSEAQSFETVSSDEAVLKIVSPAKVLAGQTTGYLVVRPVAEGKATIRIGAARLEVGVVSRPSAVMEAFDRPTIEGPANGAAVWGKVSVGVSYWDIAPASAGEPHAQQGAWLSVQGLDELRPVRTTNADDGPLVHACFEFDTADLPEGPVRLIARIVDAEGRERKSLPTVVRIVRADSGAMVMGECEEDYGVDEPNPYEPPQRQQSSRGAVQQDGRASGGRYFSNAGSFPRFGFPVEVESAGWYQLAIVAAADISMGTLPSIGIVVNPATGMDNTPVTSGPVLAEGWHRLSLGVPFRLDAGKQTVRLYFMNDFYAGGGADRNLRLDRWELLRVADAKGSGNDAAGSRMMSGGMMAMQGMSSGGGGMMATAENGGGSGGADAMMSMMSMTSSRGSDAGAADAGGAWPASVAAMNATGEGPLRIAFAEVMDGRSLPGEIELRGAVWQSAADRDAARAQAPRVALLIDGREVASQYAYAPRFRLRPDQLRAGTNFVSMAAVTAAGLTARAPEQRLSWRDHEDVGDGRGGSAHYRFTVHDPAWSENTRALRSTEKQPEDRISAGLHSNTTLALTLPDELEGEFGLEAEAMGQNFDGPAVLEFAVLTGEAAGAAFDPSKPPSPLPAAIASLRVPTNWWGPHELELREPLKLARGPKRLLVSFVNDRYEEGKGDRNAWLAAVSLVGPMVNAADVRPRLAVTYPHENAGASKVFGQGAVVVKPTSATLVRKLELLIDGQPSGMVMDTARRAGPFVIQYSVAGLSAGRHRLSVRAWTHDWTTFDSIDREIEVLAQRPALPTEYERAVVILDRFGFGPSQRDLAEILLRGADNYLMQELSGTLDTEGELAAIGLASVRFPNPRGEYDVVRRVLSHTLTTPNPVRARFVLWAQNHFSTYIRKTEGRRKADEHEAFARLGVAPFVDLLRASATSPAMLRYLDQERSYARRINENYAREIMELHTLGVHGGYTQEDVTSLACILTGWSTAGHADGRGGMGGEGVAVEMFRFDPKLSDPRERTVLGFAFPETPARDRYARVDTALELLASHPSTGKLICRKLVEHYCCTPAPEDLVEELASTFARSGGEMQAVLRDMAQHPAFWREATKPRIAHPLDFGVRMARVTGETNAHAVGEFMQSSGQGLFERPTPDGYPEADADSMSSNAMLQRWRLARRAEWQLVALAPGELRHVERNRDEPTELEARQIIDTVALRLTGRVLGERSFVAARDVLSGTTGQRDERVRAVSTFVAQTPEAGIK